MPYIINPNLFLNYQKNINQKDYDLTNLIKELNNEIIEHKAKNNGVYTDEYITNTITKYTKVINLLNNDKFLDKLKIKINDYKKKFNKCINDHERYLVNYELQKYIESTEKKYNLKYKCSIASSIKIIEDLTMQYICSKYENIINQYYTFDEDIQDAIKYKICQDICYIVNGSYNGIPKNKIINDKLIKNPYIFDDELKLKQEYIKIFDGYFNLSIY